MADVVAPYSMKVLLQSAASTNRANITPTGFLQATGEGTALFDDQFAGSTLDTTFRWNPTVLAGAGAVTQASGSLTLSLGTGASSAAAVSTVESFISLGQSALKYGTLIQFEAGAAGLLPLNTHAFFGQGTPNASYTASTPITDGIGFERLINGTFRAVIYNATVATSIIDLTSRVLDGAPHIIAIAARGDYVFFFFDNLEDYVGISVISGPATTLLPMRFSAINHTSVPAVAPTIKSYVIAAIDTGNNYPVIFNGATIARARSPVIFKNLNAVAITSEATIWTPASGKKFRLMGFVFETGTVGGNVLLKDNTAGATILIVPFGAANGVIVSPPMGNGILSATANNVLTATGSATQTLSGYVFGCEE